jgi:CheY-like chemotaxis protein
LHGSLDQIQAAGTRAAELCKQMLTYAGQGSGQLQPVNLNSIAAEVVDLTKVSFGKPIRVNLDLASTPTITAEETQLRRVLMNLMLNAAEALGDKSGAISVRTRLVPAAAVDTSEAVLACKTVASNYLELVIADTGCGMTKQTLDRAFEPFFTTKFPGRGLGLSAVLGTVRGHNGILHVQSQPGEGTTVRIYLPCPEPETPALPYSAAKPAPGTAGTILLVEDESSVRECTQTLLNELGYSVLVAESGTCGLSLFQLHAQELTAIILDLALPGAAGEELYQRVREVRPQLPVLVSSGFGEETTMRRLNDRQQALFLHKPFTLEMLASKLRACTTPAEPVSSQ